MKEKYIHLCTKRISGEISSNEGKKLDEWLNTSIEHRKIYNEILNLWQQMIPPKAPVKPTVADEWKEFEHSLENISILNEQKKQITLFQNRINFIKKFVYIKFRPAYITISVVSFIIICLTIWYQFIKAPEIKTYITLNKEKKEIVLSDNSLITMNCGSLIKVSDDFSDSLRQVYLEGEAFFQVKKDINPFFVITKNAKITVLGTKFNVWSRGEKTRMIVQHGKVRFGSINDSTYLILEKGQMSDILGDHPPDEIKNVDVDYFLAWMYNKLVFERTKLSEVLAEIERNFDIIIELKSAELATHTITASYEIESIDEILASLCLTLGAHYRFDSGKYIIEL